MYEHQPVHMRPMMRQAVQAQQSGRVRLVEVCLGVVRTVMHAHYEQASFCTGKGGHVDSVGDVLVENGRPAIS